MCHRHLRNIAFTSVRSVSPCAHYISLLIYPPYFGRASYYPVTVSLITLYHVLNTLLPCLLLLCTMSSITLLPCLPLLCYHVSHYSVPCLEYPVTMSLITLYHVFHYSVTMSLITLSHVFHYPVSSRNTKPQKKVDKLIIPRSHTPQNN